MALSGKKQQVAEPLPLRAIKTALDKARRILIVTHKKPDGDAMGSLLGLKRGLEKIGYKPEAVADYKSPCGFEWMGLMGVYCPETLPAPEKAGLVICLDCGEWNRIGDRLEGLLRPEKIICIDHHSSNDRFGAINWVIEEASCTAGLVGQLLDALNVPLDESILEPLYTGLVTDTSRFSNGCTRSVDFITAARWAPILTRRDPGNLSRITRLIYENKPLEQLHIEGLILERLVVHSAGKVSCSYLTRRDLDRYGVELDQLHEISGIPRSVSGVELSFMLVEERSKNVKIGFRSTKGFDTTRLAKVFGGGGHKAASGAHLDDCSIETASKKIWNLIRKMAPEMLRQDAKQCRTPKKR